jgi:hypothetical protein
MYNDRYHDVIDFKNETVDLNLTLEAGFEEKSNMTIDNEFLIRNVLPEDYSSEYPIALQYLSLGYNKYLIKSDDG